MFMLCGCCGVLLHFVVDLKECSPCTCVGSIRILK
jgi:hypothetical protein